eukprot:SAG31_NODE_17898_length_654_cov_1.014414_1_plen_190_part_01
MLGAVCCFGRAAMVPPMHVAAGYGAGLLLLYVCARCGIPAARIGLPDQATTRTACSRLVSSVNACVVTSTATYYLLYRANARADVDASPLDPLASFSIQAMIGYMIMDLLINTIVGFDSGAALNIFHHVLGLASEIATLATGYGGYATMVVHVAEGSTPVRCLLSTTATLFGVASESRERITLHIAMAMV